MPTCAVSLNPRELDTHCQIKGELLDFFTPLAYPIYAFNSQALSFLLCLFVCLLAGHLYLSEGRQRPSDIGSRTVSESNMYLNTFYHMDNDANFDTVSVGSSNSLETSISACSPQNISRWFSLSTKSAPMNKRKLFVQISWLNCIKSFLRNKGAMIIITRNNYLWYSLLDFAIVFV